MATLFNTKISQTYEGLLKTIDNAAISATLRELTDGSGNQSGLYLNTAGDFKVSAILEWGSLKDTGTGVTITRFVTSTDGLENFDNNTSLPTSAAVKLYVDTKFATSDTLEEVLSFGNTTGANNIVIQKSIQLPTTTTNNGTPTDIGVISFGGTYTNGNRIFNDSSGGTLRIQGSNNLQLYAPNHKISNVNGTLIQAGDTGVRLYYQNSEKLITTATGVTITGRLSGLTNPTLSQDATTKSYVDALDAGSDLDITDGTTAGAVNLNTQSLSILGTTNEIDSVVSGQSVTIGLPTSISTNLVGNVTGNLTGNVAGNLTGTVNATSILADGVTATTQASSDDSEKVATTAYVKGLDNASDLDFSGTTGTGDVNLNTQTLAVTGTANQITTAASNQGLEISLLSTGVTMPNNSVATTQSAGDDSTKIATTEYVDTSAALYLPLVGGIMSGNTIHNDSVKSLYGTGSDAEIYHDGSDFYAKNSTGDLYIDQAAVTKSIFFRVSDANALDVTALTISRNGDLITGRDVTIAGDLTVNGTTTTVNSQTLAVVDPLIQLAKDNTANSLDIGLYGDYNDGTGRYLGLFSDASDGNKFKLFKGTTVEPTTTVNIGGAGYVAADLQVAGFEATTGAFGGNITTNGYLTLTGQATPQIFMASNTAGTPSWTFIARNDGYFLLGRSGVSNDFYFDPSGNATFSGDVNLPDSKKAIFGAGNDLQIYHDGSNSYIDETGAGGLIIKTGDFYLRNPSNAEMIRASSGASVELYEAGSKKFETTSTGVSVTGDGIFTGDVFLKGTYNPYSAANRGNITLNGTASNIVAFTDNTIGKGYIYHNGTDFEILNAAAGVLKFSTNGTERMNINNSGNATFLNNLGIGYAVQTNIKTYVYDNSADYGLVVQQDGAGIPFQVSSTGSLKMIVANNGNVGIGTDSPVGDGTALNLYGTTASTLKLQTSSSGTAITDGGEIVMYDNDLIIKNREAGYIQFATTGTERMRITSAGKLLVGITSGGTFDMAVIKGANTVANDLTLIGPNTSQVRINFGDTDSSQQGEIGYNNSTDSMRIVTNATEKMRITSGGNVGIGTDSPAFPLEVQNVSTAYMFSETTGAAASSGYRWKTPDSEFAWFSTGGTNAMSLYDYVAGAERMRIDSTGNVGIGTDSPSTKTEIKQTNNDIYQLTLYNSHLSTTSKARIGNWNSDIKISSNYMQSGGTKTQDDIAKASWVQAMGAEADSFIISRSPAGSTTLSSLMSITSGGAVIIGTGGAFSAGSGNIQINRSSDGGYIQTSATVTSAVDHRYFYNPNGLVGRIQTSGSTTSYVTSSDYRLKEDLQDFAGLDMVSKIPVYDFKWKVDESRSYGVMAHELQDVLPDAVSGEKDAEEMQGVDYSKIVPLLVKSIQELKAEIDILKSQNCKCKI